MQVCLFWKKMGKQGKAREIGWSGKSWGILMTFDKTRRTSKYGTTAHGCLFIKKKKLENRESSGNWLVRKSFSISNS